MVEFPHSMRVLLVDELDEFCETIDETSSPEAVAEAVVEALESVATQVSGVDAECILADLEESGELEGSLVEALEARFLRGFDYTGESVVAFLERRTEIEWSDEDDNSDTVGDFGGDDLYGLED